MFNSDCDLHTGACSPTEVYCEEFVPNSIELPSSSFSGSKLLFNNRNHFTMLNLTFRWDSSRVSLSTFKDFYIDFERNYKFRIQFPDAYWSSNYLGYGTQDVIYEYPCRVTGTFVQSAQSVKCDLYLDKNFNSNFFVDIYGIVTSDLDHLDQNPFINVIIPRLKLYQSNSPRSVYVIFSILEETPGMKKPFVELYYDYVYLGELITPAISKHSLREQEQASLTDNREAPCLSQSTATRLLQLIAPAATQLLQQPVHTLPSLTALIAHGPLPAQASTIRTTTL